MSVLLVAPPPERGTATLKKLVAQGDEVRVVVERDEADLRSKGAHVAVGDPADDDLIERAGQHARTIVVFDADATLLSAALAGADRAGIERVIVVGDRLPSQMAEILSGTALSYVVLRTRRKMLPRRAPSEEAVADAIDAADDLAGNVKLDLDLSRPGDWAALGLSPR